MRTKFKKLCECGCGDFVSRSKLPPHKWNKYILGHHRRGEKVTQSHETKLKISKTLTGRKLSIEHTKNISKALTGRKFSNEWKRKLSGENASNWKGGISCEPYCDVWIDKEYKQSIRERDNNECQNPDCWHTSNHLSLTIHHIDYIKKNCIPKNLLTLCQSCNGRANFNREEWTVFYQKIIERKENENVRCS